LQQRLLQLATIAVLVPADLTGQIERAEPVLAAAVRETAAGVYYSYELTHTGAPGEIWSDIMLDVATPRRTTPPLLLWTRGPVLRLGLGEHWHDRPHWSGHPPLGIATPENWPAAVYFNGSVSWGATRYPGGPNYGVRHGETLGGFELESPALPTWRKFRVIPYRSYRSADDPGGVDSTEIIYVGYVLAPGLMPDEINAAHLRSQIEIACILDVLRNCADRQSAIDRLALAEEAANPAEYRSAVRALRSVLDVEEMEHTAALVFGRLLAAFQERVR
jgi:hypothetical protein